MAVLTFRHFHKSFGTQVCFDNAEGSIEKDDRIGLIGANGTGKSTLAKAICGLIERDEGFLEIKKGLRIEYLAQEPLLTPGRTVLQETFALAFEGLRAAEEALDALNHRLADPALDADAMERLLKELAEAQDRFEAEGGYLAEARTEATLMGLGFGKDDLQKPTHGLSGGECSRVALSVLLLREPELMILDEPTNHLDVHGIDWLETFLREQYKGSLLVISHDRYFLDRVTNRTWELRSGGKLVIYRGNFTKSRESKEEQRLAAERAFEQQQNEIEKQRAFIRRFKAGQRSKEAKGRERRLERLLEDGLLKRPGQERSGPKLNLTTEQRVGQEVCEGRDLAFRYGDLVLFEGFTLEVKPNEVLGIAGPNGAGKSTLLRCLTKELEPTEGRVKWGGSIKPAHLQQLENFDDAPPAMDPGKSVSVFDYLRHHAAPATRDKEIRDHLAALLFRGDEIDKPLDVLSGGERKRLALAKLLWSEANLLFLDEPTNHLDIPAREALEDALEQFPGTIIMISHDRYLLDRLADRIVWMEDGNAEAFVGNFSTMQSLRQKQRQAEAERLREIERAKDHAKSPATKKPPTQAHQKKPKPKRRFQGSLQDLEAEIERLTERITGIEVELSSDTTYEDGEQVKELAEEYERIQTELAQLEDEWLERQDR